MRVLLDTDVVLDFVLEREPFVEAAGALFELIARGVCDGYISAVTPLNVFYIGRKLKGAAQTKQSISDLLAAVRVCPVDGDILHHALALPFADYEDATQYACATANGLDAIVTRNLDDYKNVSLPVFSPTDFLDHLKSL